MVDHAMREPEVGPRRSAGLPWPVVFVLAIPTLTVLLILLFAYVFRL